MRSLTHDYFIKPLKDSEKRFYDGRGKICDECEELILYRGGFKTVYLLGHAYTVRKLFCKQHAKEFSEKHKLEILCN